MALSTKAKKRLEVALGGAAAYDSVVKELVASISNGGSPAGAVADIATADATDLATAVALANATKAKVNELLASLRAGGVIS